jgi:hypothetical protein
MLNIELYQRESCFKLTKMLIACIDLTTHPSITADLTCTYILPDTI